MRRHRTNSRMRSRIIRFEAAKSTDHRQNGGQPKTGGQQKTYCPHSQLGADRPTVFKRSTSHPQFNTPGRTVCSAEKATATRCQRLEGCFTEKSLGNRLKLLSKLSTMATQFGRSLLETALPMVVDARTSILVCFGIVAVIGFVAVARSRRHALAAEYVDSPVLLKVSVWKDEENPSNVKKG